MYSKILLTIIVCFFLSACNSSQEKLSSSSKDFSKINFVENKYDYHGHILDYPEKLRNELYFWTKPERNFNLKNNHLNGWGRDNVFQISTKDYPIFETIFNERKEALIALWPSNKQNQIRKTLERESEPLTKLLQENVYREVLLRSKLNAQYRAVLLAYATGTDLDAKVADYGIQRLIISPEDLTTTPPTPAVYERDEDLRYRASKAFDALSVAGPTSAYEFHSLSADGRVADAYAFSPAPVRTMAPTSRS